MLFDISTLISMDAIRVSPQGRIFVLERLPNPWNSISDSNFVIYKKFRVSNVSIHLEPGISLYKPTERRKEGGILLFIFGRSLYKSISLLHTSSLDLNNEEFDCLFPKGCTWLRIFTGGGKFFIMQSKTVIAETEGRKYFHINFSFPFDLNRLHRFEFAP